MRVSVEVRSRFHDGMDIQHFCLECGARRKGSGIGSMDGLRTLRWADQEAVVVALGGDPASVLDASAKDGADRHWGDYDSLVATCKPKLPCLPRKV